MKLLGVLSRKKFATMTILYIVAFAFYVMMYFKGFHRMSVDDAQGMGSIVQAFTNLYGMLAGLTLISLWGTFGEIEAHVRQEAGLLDDILRFATALEGQSLTKIQHCANLYLRQVVEEEWQSLAKSKESVESEKSFSNFFNSVVEAVKHDNSHICGCMLNVLSLVSLERDKRIAASVSRIPKPMLYLVHFHALALVFLVFLTGFNRLMFGSIAFLLISVALFMTYFAIVDMNNPFTGIMIADKDPFEKLLKKHEQPKGK